MTAPFKFSIRLNNDLAIDDYVRLAQAAERSRFDQFWVSNDLFLNTNHPTLMACFQAVEKNPAGPRKRIAGEFIGHNRIQILNFHAARIG